MTLSWSNIAIGLLWAGLGVFAALLLMRSIQASAKSFVPEMKSAAPVLGITVGMFLRMFIIAGLLYLSVRMGIIFSLIFIVTFSIIRFVLISKLSRQAKNEQSSQVRD